MLCRILKESKKLLSEQLALKNFYVLTISLTTQNTVFIMDCLKDSSIPGFYIQLSVRKEDCFSKLVLHHPSALAYEEISDHLNQEIFNVPSKKKYRCLYAYQPP
jgi:hypothetical protein